jgi:hypothetical protein
MLRFLLIIPLTAIISACSYPINKVDVNTDKLITSKPIGTLNCSYRLLAINDTRPEGRKSGGLGLNKLSFPEPQEYIKVQLFKAGLLPANSTNGRPVAVDIKHVYLNQNNGSKIPTVVYEIQLDGLDKFIIRGQIASVNWNGSENEAYDAFAAAFQSANAQLIAKLNNGCAQ